MPYLFYKLVTGGSFKINFGRIIRTSPYTEMPGLFSSCITNSTTYRITCTYVGVIVWVVERMAASLPSVIGARHSAHTHITCHRSSSVVLGLARFAVVRSFVVRSSPRYTHRIPNSRHNPQVTAAAAGATTTHATTKHTTTCGGHNCCGQHGKNNVLNIKPLPESSKDKQQTAHRLPQSVWFRVISRPLSCARCSCRRFGVMRWAYHTRQDRSVSARCAFVFLCV